MNLSSRNVAYKAKRWGKSVLDPWRGLRVCRVWKGVRMASTGKELLGEHYEEDHLSAEQIAQLGLKVVTEDGQTVGPEALRSKIFRIADRDDASGYVVSSMESTGTATVLCYLQAS